MNTKDYIDTLLGIRDSGLFLPSKTISQLDWDPVGSAYAFEPRKYTPSEIASVSMDDIHKQFGVYSAKHAYFNIKGYAEKCLFEQEEAAYYWQIDKLSEEAVVAGNILITDPDTFPTLLTLANREDADYIAHFIELWEKWESHLLKEELQATIKSGTQTKRRGTL